MKSFLLVLLLCIGAQAQSSVSSHDKAKITEIYLEMGQGTVNLDQPLGRTFMITLRRDGTATYVGVANVGLIGTFVGRISTGEFDKLAQFVIDKKYYNISNELPVRLVDNSPLTFRIREYEPPVVVTGIMYDGKPKFIKRETIVPIEREKSIPKEIIAIEDAITDAAKKIRWSKVTRP